MRMPSPAQRAPREQAVGSECTGYSSAAPKAEADINSWGSLRHNAARISQTWDSALYGGADPPGGCPSGPRDALVPLVSRRIKPFQNPAGRPGGRRRQREPPRGSAGPKGTPEGVRPTNYAGVRLWGKYVALG